VSDTDTDPVRPDNPNQELVRPDGSGPADEGRGAGKPARSSSSSGDGEKRRPGRPPKPKDDSAPDAD